MPGLQISSISGRNYKDRQKWRCFQKVNIAILVAMEAFAHMVSFHATLHLPSWLKLLGYRVRKCPVSRASVCLLLKQRHYKNQTRDASMSSYPVGSRKERVMQILLLKPVSNHKNASFTWYTRLMVCLSFNCNPGVVHGQTSYSQSLKLSTNFQVCKWYQANPCHCRNWVHLASKCSEWTMFKWVLSSPAMLVTVPILSGPQGH